MSDSTPTYFLSTSKDGDSTIPLSSVFQSFTTLPRPCTFSLWAFWLAWTQDSTRLIDCGGQPPYPIPWRVFPVTTTQAMVLSSRTSHTSVPLDTGLSILFLRMPSSRQILGSLVQDSSKLHHQGCVCLSVCVPSFCLTPSSITGEGGS